MNLNYFAICLCFMLTWLDITNLTVVYILLLSVALLKDVHQVVLTREINTNIFLFSGFKFMSSVWQLMLLLYYDLLC